ncbi:MAG: hypothetical protein QFX35_05295 [Candidatus Verstraetearchaeota archaeon]|nr:hypothetical protein [Candidatus Verstraetearchaeota archaeon]
MSERNKVGSPTGEVKILVAIEAFAGITYLIYLLRSQYFDAFLALPFAMAFVSFGISYGLYRVKRLAWYLSLSLSLFGLVFGTLGLFLVGLTLDFAVDYVPRILLDLITVVLLLSSNVRRTFKVLWR